MDPLQIIFTRCCRGTEVCEEEAVRVTELVPRNMTQFRFEQEILTNGSVVAVQCVVCGQVGPATLNFILLAEAMSML